MRWSHQSPGGVGRLGGAPTRSSPEADGPAEGLEAGRSRIKHDRKPNWAVGVLLAIIAVASSGCGGGSSASTPPPTSAPTLTPTWVDVRIGDLNGDGKADIVGRDLSTGQWWANLGKTMLGSRL